MVGIGRIAKVAGIVLGGLVVLVAGLYVGGAVGPPDAGLEDNRWGEVTDDGIGVVTTVWIDNPNPFGVSSEDTTVDYDLALNDVHLAEGTKDGVAVPQGNSTTTLETRMRHEQFPEWWATHVGNDEVSNLTVTANVDARAGPFSASHELTYEDRIETDLESVIEESLSELEGEYTGTETEVGDVGGVAVEPTVEVRDTEARWGEVDENSTELLATFHVHNPNAYPIPTPAFTGETEFNNVTVAEWDANEVDVVRSPENGTIPPQATEEVTFRVSLDNQAVADWFATHVERNETTDAEVRAQLALSVSGSQVTMPRDDEAVRCEYDVRTAIFVDQEAGAEREDCEFTPLTTTREDLEAANATLDLTETEWWDEQQSESDDGDDDIGLRVRPAR